MLYLSLDSAYVDHSQHAFHRWPLDRGIHGHEGIGWIKPYYIHILPQMYILASKAYNSTSLWTKPQGPVNLAPVCLCGLLSLQCLSPSHIEWPKDLSALSLFPLLLFPPPPPLLTTTFLPFLPIYLLSPEWVKTDVSFRLNTQNWSSVPWQVKVSTSTAAHANEKLLWPRVRAALIYGSTRR